MTVYVDDALIPAEVGRLDSRWSHLYADTEDELHEFAARLGLRRSWFQRPKGFGRVPLNPASLQAQMWHYDVTESKRAQAIRLGATPVTEREGRLILRERHARLFPEAALNLARADLPRDEYPGGAA